MSEEQEIDGVVRSKLIDYEEIPSAAVWDGVDANLNTGRKRFPFFYWLIVGVLLGGVAVSLAYELSEKPTYHPRQTPYVSNDKSNSELNDWLADLSTKNSAESQPSLKQPYMEGSIEPEPSANAKHVETPTKSPSQSRATKTDLSPRPGVSSSYSDSENKSLADEGNSRGTNPIQPPARSASIFHLEDPSMIPLLSLVAIDQDISKNLWNRSKTDLDLRPKGIWYIGAFVGYDLNGKDAEAKGSLPAYQDSLLVTEENANHFGGGFLASYRTPSGWRFSSSISFGKWCQSTAYDLKISGQYETSGNPTGTLEQGVITSVGNGNIVVNYDELDFLPSTALSPEVYSLSYRTEECYSRLSIPLEIGYELNFGRFNLVPELSAGYAYFFNYQRSETASAELPSLRFEKTSDFNHHTVYLGFGGQVEYSITDRWSIGVGYTNQQWITPLFETENFETSPRIQSMQAQFLFRL